MLRVIFNDWLIYQNILAKHTLICFGSMVRNCKQNKWKIWFAFSVFYFTVYMYTCFHDKLCWVVLKEVFIMSNLGIGVADLCLCTRPISFCLVWISCSNLHTVMDAKLCVFMFVFRERRPTFAWRLKVLAAPAMVALAPVAAVEAEARAGHAATPHVAAEGLHVPGVQSLAPAPAPRFTLTEATVCLRARGNNSCVLTTDHLMC